MVGTKVPGQVADSIFMTRTADAPVIELAQPRAKPKPRPAPKAKAIAKAKASPKPKRTGPSVREVAARTLRDLADRADEQY